MSKRVAVLGASNNTAKYGYKATMELKNAGFEVLPVNPKEERVCNLKCYKTISDISGDLDTVTLYLPPAVTDKIADQIVNQNPRRIVMNPGAESNILKQAAQDKGIEVIEACTLVMLRTNKF